MAAVTAQHPPAYASQVVSDFVGAFDSLQKQLQNGNSRPSVSLTQISSLGSDAVNILKHHLEIAAHAEFKCYRNAATNSVTYVPTKPMPPNPTTTANGGSTTTTSEGNGEQEKIRRPPNAFIIYRKDWHPVIVAQNPGFHNNDISKIIGEQWRAEDQSVRDAYKQKANEAKQQHKAAHPDYQYQPRKPSEKRKRMTKNKLAKLAAKAAESSNGTRPQQPLPQFDPFGDTLALVNQELGQRAASSPVEVTYPKIPSPGPILQTTTNAAWLAFQAGIDQDTVLAAQMEDYNSAPHCAAFQGGAISVGAQPTIDGQFYDQTTNFDLDCGDLASYEAPAATVSNPAVALQATVSNPAMALQHNPSAEVARQDALEQDFDNFFDHDAYNANSSADFTQDYELNNEIDIGGETFTLDFLNGP